MSVLREFTPELEVYSIDEAFLSLVGFRDLEGHARSLRSRVLQWTGIPVSVGIAPTKTLAKVANRTAKKDLHSGGVRDLMRFADQERALACLELTDLWGVAGRLAARLRDLGVHTPLQLRDADPSILRERLGVVVQRIALELRGEPSQSLTLAIPNNKSILASRSFGRIVTDRREVEEAVCSHIARAAEKLRRQNLVAGLVMVFVTTNPFRPQDRQYQASKTIELPVASADTITLTRAALLAARAVFRDGYRYKKAGITLLDLSPADTVQGDLWIEPDSPRSKSLMRAVDAINTRHGRESIKLAGSGIERGWKLRSEQRSACFTTDWNELLRVEG